MEVVKTLTKEVIEDMVIHPTMGGLKRSTAINGCDIVSATEEVPTLYYEKVGDNQVIHAVSSELIKYLLTLTLE